MPDKEQKLFNQKFWETHEKVMKDLENGLLEHEIGLLPKITREEALAELEQMKAANKKD